MKNWRGWLALLIFGASCVVIGMNRYLMRSLNTTVILMLLIAAVLVFLLQSHKGIPQKDTMEEFSDEKMH